MSDRPVSDRPVSEEAAAALLDGLDEHQVAAVTARAPALRILAGAGSGKTRVLTRRIAHRALTGDADPRHVLALTFTRRAAAELADRIGALGIHDLPTAGTFHAVAWAQLQSWWADRGRTAPRILRSKPAYVRRVLRSGELGSTLAVTAEIDWAAARVVPADRYTEAVRRSGRRTPLAPTRLAQIIEAYNEEKRRRGVVDFDDLLGMCAAALVRDPAFGDAQRWRFRHVFVDEFQDLNPLQFRLLRAWLPPDGDVDLCVVGDPNQAIYGWNGADNRFLARFDEAFPGAATVQLERNYRSSPHVIAAACAALGPAAAQRPTRPPGPLPTVSDYADEAAEAAGVAAAVLDASRVPGRTWSAQAVLVRTHAQGVLIARTLEEQGVPVKLHTRTAERAQDGSQDEADDDDRPAPRGAAAGDGDGDGDQVEVATFHAAKGLEWPVVHVAGLEDGLVPHVSAATPRARAEEQRLLYVAITRAERELHLSWARRRTFRDRTHERRPSPWLADVVDAIDRRTPSPAAIPAPAPTHPPSHPATQPPERRPARSTEPAASPGDGPEAAAADRALAALRSWRETQARGARIEPGVVLSDRALERIAQHRPTTTEELAALAEVGPVRASRWGDALLAIVAAAPDG